MVSLQRCLLLAIACLRIVPAAAETLLVVRKSDDAVDFMDPGSSLRLAPGSVLPVGLLVSRNGRTAYVAATLGDRVVEFDTATLEVLRSIDVGGEPDGLGSTLELPRAVCHGCMPLENSR